jgi:site-specific recombinase XerD
LKRFLGEKRLMRPTVLESPSQTSAQLSSYAAYLGEVRGVSPSTIRNHLRTARRFLEHAGYEGGPRRLADLSGDGIETFVRSEGQRLGRASLQQAVAHLRGLLRFLAGTGEVRVGLDNQIDTPRLYRLERLPQALPWRTVRTLLDSIDRSTPRGLRDYTMLFLVATYGLRISEIVALTLDDIDWRAREIRLARRKTRTPLSLPLTDAAGTVLLRYLRRARPSCPHRELFLRARAPIATLRPGAVTTAFKTWVRRSELEIPRHGAHSLRHSYAVHLLRRGASLKDIGDLLGHRSAESTCVYLRLATEDLRGVALPLPRSSRRRERTRA